MLTTLLKHEWKDTWILCTVCNAITLFLSMIGALIIVTSDFTKGRDFSDSQRVLLVTGISAYVLVYVFSIVAVALVIRYYFFIRYYKNLFTDQGYLMHTLPARATDLINSKLIIALFWQYATGIIMALSIFILIAAFIGSMDEISPQDISETFSDIEWEWLAKNVFSIIASVLVVLLMPILEILVFYMAVGIGQMSKKNRLFISVLVLIGINVGKRSLTSIITMPYQIYYIESERAEDFIAVVPFVLLVFMIGAIIGLYFLNKFFIEKKLNLE